MLLMLQLSADGAAREPDKAPVRKSQQNSHLHASRRCTECFVGTLHHLQVAALDRVTIFAHNGIDYLLGISACWSPVP